MLELDVRVLPPPKKHTTIHEKLALLAPGETLRITNDHDPRPLRFELDHDHPNVFSFEYVESGPLTWLVDIVKAKAVPAEPRLELIADAPHLSVSKISLDAGASLPSHKVGESLAIIVTEGTALLSLRGSKRRLGVGDVELLMPSDTFSLEATEAAQAYVVRAKATGAA